MEGFGIEKLALILVIVLVMFGARRIPEIGASFGKGIREFKRGMSDLTNDAGADPVAPQRIAPSAISEQAEPSAEVEPKRLLSR